MNQNPTERVLEVDWDDVEVKTEPEVVMQIPTPRQIKNFAKFVDKSGGPDACWLWTGYRNERNYGSFRMAGSKRGAHRAAYAIKHGGVPVGKLVCHKCDNPPCVNPDHLFIGDSIDNARDMVSKGRQASGARNGSCIHPESRPRGDQHHLRRMPHLIKRGVDNPRSKINPDVVREIRSMRVAGKSLNEIKDRFGISEGAVSHVLAGRSWGYVV